MIGNDDDDDDDRVRVHTHTSHHDGRTGRETEGREGRGGEIYEGRGGIGCIYTPHTLCTQCKYSLPDIPPQHPPTPTPYLNSPPAHPPPPVSY